VLDLILCSFLGFKIKTCVSREQVLGALDTKFPVLPSYNSLQFFVVERGIIAYLYVKNLNGTLYISKVI